MEYCIYIPKTKNNQESKLFKQLYDYTKDRDITKSIYSVVTNNEFQILNKDFLIYDENDEPTLESVLKLLDVEKTNGTEIERKFLEDKLNNNLPTQIIDVVEKVVKFNQENRNFIALVDTINGSKTHITVVRKNSNTNKQASDLEKNYKVYRKLDSFLTTLGLKINLLDANLMYEEDGLIVPEHLKHTVDGIFGVINIANNINGFKQVTEEVAHFIIENIDDNPIIQRCEKYLKENPEMIKEILGDDYINVTNYYNNKNRPDLIVRETLGRMCAEIINNNIKDESLSIFQRAVNIVKNTINSLFKLDSNNKYKQFSQLKKDLSSLMKDVFNQNIVNKETLKRFNRQGNILAHASTKTNQIKNSIDEVQAILVGNLLHYLNVYEDAKDIDVLNNVKKQLEHLNSNYTKNSFLKGTSRYLSELITLLTKNRNNLKNVILKDDMTIYDLRSNAHSLIQMRNLIQSYREPLQELSMICQEVIDDTLTDQRLTKENANSLLETIRQCQGYLDDYEAEYFRLNKKMLLHICEPFFGEDGNLKGPNTHSLANKDGIISLETVLEYSMGDINGFNRMCVSAANTNDLFIGLLDAMIKNAQEEIRAATTKFDHRIQAIDRKYRESGEYKGYDFMFAHTKNGISNGKYNQYDWEKFEKDKEKFLEVYENKDLGLKKWKETHETKKEFFDKNKKQKRVCIVPIDTYLYDKSQWNAAQREYFESFIQAKEELDWLLPKQYFNPYVCIQMMVSSTGEAILNSENGIIGGITGAAKSLKTNYFEINDNDNGEFFGTADSQAEQAHRKKLITRLMEKMSPKERNEVTKRATNFDHTPYKKVPIYFVNELNDMSKLSRDATSTLREYAIMAQQYSGMHKIVDTMELMRDQARVHKVLKRQPGYKITDHSKFENAQMMDKNTELSNFYKLANYIIDSKVYMQSKQQGSKILGTNLTTGKLADDLIKLTAFSLLGYSGFSAINNINVAKYQMFIESSGGRYFNYKDWLWADKEYIKLIPDALPELFTPYSNSKMSLIREMFNIGQHWKEKIKESKSWKNGAEQFISNLGPSFMLEMGEDHIQMSTALAYLKHYKLYDIKPEFDDKGNITNGAKSISLIEAIDKEDIEENGKVVDSKLIIKREYKSYVKDDGEKFQFYHGSEDIKDLTLTIGNLNQQMHGIYNREDAAEITQYALGRMALLFRRHIVPQMQKRYKTLGKKEAMYNFMTGEWEEGYVVTALRTFLKIITPSKDKGINFWTKYQLVKENLQDYEKENLKKFFAEMGALATLFFLLTFIVSGWDDEDDWMKRQTYYYIRRLQMEAEFPYKPVSNGMSILVSPSAVISPIQRYARIVEDVGKYDKILKTGPYKGHSVLYADIMRAMPIYPQVKDFIYIDEDNRRFKMFDNSGGNLFEDLVTDEE